MLNFKYQVGCMLFLLAHLNLTNYCAQKNVSHFIIIALVSCGIFRVYRVNTFQPRSYISTPKISSLQCVIINFRARVVFIAIKMLKINFCPCVLHCAAVKTFE